MHFLRPVDNVALRLGNLGCLGLLCTLTLLTVTMSFMTNIDGNVAVDGDISTLGG